MRYEKPLVIDLQSTTRQATGLEPLACISGSGPGLAQSCGTGNSADYSCVLGNLPYTNGGSCLAGPAPGSASDCYTGGAANFECGAGVGATMGSSCTVGPSNI